MQATPLQHSQGMATPLMNAADARVLVADDSEVGQLLAISTLNKLGFKNIHTVSDGLSALAAYENNSFHLVVLDCQMPKLDGYQTTIRIRQNEIAKNRRVPIIAVTAESDDDDSRRSRQAGMDGYATKPLLPNKIRPILTSWFLLATEHNNGTHDEGNTALIDQQQLRLFTNGDKDREIRIATLFFQHADETFKKMEESVAHNNAEEWCFLSHRLKGAALSFGATYIQHLSAQAEADPGASIIDKQTLLETLRVTIKRTRELFTLAD